MSHGPVRNFKALEAFWSLLFYPFNTLAPLRAADQVLPCDRFMVDASKDAAVTEYTYDLFERRTCAGACGRNEHASRRTNDQ